MSAPLPGLVARWITRRPPAAGAVCDECGEALAAAECRCCGQLGGETVGMLAALIDTPAGARLVIAEHTAQGWVPVRTVPATPANVAALARPGATGPATTATSTTGGLW